MTASELHPQPTHLVRPRKQGRGHGKQAEFDRRLQEELDAGNHVHVASHRGVKCVSKHCQHDLDTKMGRHET